MKILITIWGPEYGCLYRQIEIAKKLQQFNCKVKFLVHKNHISIIKEYFGNKSICGHFNWKIVKYDEKNDLDLFMTILYYFKFILFECLVDFFKFWKIIKNNNFDIIMTDFIPHNIIYSKILKIKCISIFNYALIDNNSNLFFYQKITHNFVRYIFWFLYKTSTLCIIETMYDLNDIKDKIIFIKPIAINKKRNKDFLKNKLGITKNCSLIFYSMGGGFFKYKRLFLLDNLIRQYDNIKIFILPRNKKELLFLKHKLENILMIDDITCVPSKYIYNADLVITKSSFRTIADCIKNKCLILPIHTPNHPEIFESELYLKNNKIAKEILYNIDKKNIEKIKSILKEKTLVNNYNDISFCNMDTLVDIILKVKDEK